jgi:hypothetical protein
MCLIRGSLVEDAAQVLELAHLFYLCSLPLPLILFTFRFSLSTPSTVISVSSGAVCFSFICVSAFPSYFLPSSGFIKYSSLIRFYFSFGLCISIRSSLLLFTLPSPLSVFCFFFFLHLSLSLFLCIFFSLVGMYFRRFWSSQRLYLFLQQVF